MKSTLMKLAIDQAKKALVYDEVPVGAVLYDHENNKIISARHNEVISLNDPTAHAEILAIREACAHLGSNKLPNMSIYVTSEPCAMCAQAISFSHIKYVYFGTENLKYGSIFNGARIFYNANSVHKPEIYGGFEEDECKKLLQDFFYNKR